MPFTPIIVKPLFWSLQVALSEALLKQEVSIKYDLAHHLPHVMSHFDQTSHPHRRCDCGFAYPIEKSYSMTV